MTEDHHQRTRTDKYVDLHVLIVPASLWREDLRFTHVNTCTESVSGGFVRICPNLSLQSLRKEIVKQLDIKLLPESYVFLRNVGRLLTWVAAKQEKTLKAELFLPPFAPCPEIYILDANCLQGWEAGEPISVDVSAKIQSHAQTTAGLANTFPNITARKQQQIKMPNLHYDGNNKVPRASDVQGRTTNRHLSTNQNPPSELTNTTRYQGDGYSRRRSLAMTQHSHHDSFPPVHWSRHGKTNDSASGGGYTQLHAHSHGVRFKRSTQHSQDHTIGHTPPHEGSVLGHGSRTPGADSAIATHPLQHTPYLQQPSMQRQILHRTHPPSSVHAIVPSYPSLTHGHQQQETHMPHPQSHGHEEETSDEYDSRDRLSSLSSDEEESQTSSALDDSSSSGADGTPPVTNQALKSNYRPINRAVHGKKHDINEASPTPTRETQSREIVAKRPQTNKPMSTEAHPHYLGHSSDSSSKQSLGPKHTLGHLTPLYNATSASYPPTLSTQSNGIELHDAHTSTHPNSPIYSGKTTGLQKPADAEQQLSAGENESSATSYEKSSNETRNAKSHVRINPRDATTSTKSFLPRPRPTGKLVPRQRSQTYPIKNTAIFTRKDFESAQSRTKATSFTPSGIQSRQLPLPPIQGTNTGGDVSRGVQISSTKTPPVLPSNPLPPIPSQQTQPPSQRSNAASVQEVNDLLSQIRTTKEECDQLTVENGALASHLRSLHTNLKEERKNSDGEWRRKYFQEKKVTSSLEDRVKRKKADILRLQAQLDRRKEARIREASYSNPSHPEAPSEHNKSASLQPPKSPAVCGLIALTKLNGHASRTLSTDLSQSNIKTQCRRLEVAIKEVRERTVAAKGKLSREQKAHMSLLAECRNLRKELTAKKIACTRTRGHGPQ